MLLLNANTAFLKRLGQNASHDDPGELTCFAINYCSQFSPVVTYKRTLRCSVSAEGLFESREVGS